MLPVKPGFHMIVTIVENGCDDPGDHVETPIFFLRLQLHGAIYRPDSLILMLRYCANLKAIRYESTSLNRIVADKSHRVIVAKAWFPLDRNAILESYDSSVF